MRLSLALATVICLGAPQISNAAPDVPYKAVITSDSVYVRSGPGKQYYPTEKLAKNAPVEVYRHDPGGWYAIRPTEKSFAWVSGRYLKLVKRDVAQVIGDRVACRVGSQIVQSRDVISVRLKRGELVRIIDIDQTGSATWYKIAPPAGEFRWVYGRYVRPVDKDPTAARAANPDSDPAEGLLASDKKSKRPTESSVKLATIERNIVPNRLVRKNPRVERTDSFPAGSATIRDQVDQLDLRLSRIVAKKRSTWNFDKLRSETEALLGQAKIPLDRGRVRVVMSKIEHFGAIQKAMSETDQLGRRSESLANRNRRKSAQSVDDFDGFGRLVRVATRRPDHPRYALVDEQNQIQMYVTSIPDVNLESFRGRQVGISGTRGTKRGLRRPFVSARRIQILPSTRRR